MGFKFTPIPEPVAPVYHKTTEGLTSKEKLELNSKVVKEQEKADAVAGQPEVVAVFEDAPELVERADVTKAKVSKTDDGSDSQSKVLSDSTYVELTEMARERGLTGYSTMNKEELVAALS